MKTMQLLSGALALALLAPAAGAQGLFDRIKSRSQSVVERAIERKAEDTVSGAVKCALGDAKCIREAEASGKQVVVTDAQGREVPRGTDAQAREQAGGTSTGVSTAMRPGEGAWVNFDFVPGTKPLFVDDFARDTVGDFPRRLEFIDGNMEVAASQGARFLRVTSYPGRFAIVLPETLPPRFTVEFDATPGHNTDWTVFKFADKASAEVRFRGHNRKGQGGIQAGKRQALSYTTGALNQGELYRGRIMADGQYVKVYINDTRVANVPNADLGRSNKIIVQVPGNERAPAFIGNISVMAGGKKLYDSLAENGRVATQGIYFDTGSDRIRPESTPTLKEIAAMLKEYPDLRLVIEGHTDNVGSAAANQALSEKRAAAVKSTLATNFEVDGTRLEAKGFGTSQPVGKNDTPEGRQSNRRVELVRL